MNDPKTLEIPAGTYDEEMLVKIFTAFFSGDEEEDEQIPDENEYD